jgi:UDP-N-acetylmuramoyl-tripeptide--D-alanyl-D-alanine ligase
MNIKDLYSIFQFHPNIITDSRKELKNSIFFALKGEKFNGNEFAEIAINQGCSYAIIDEKKHQKDLRFILVDDVLRALQDLAKYHRAQLNIPVIGITGTNGKTTTKELIRSILSKKYNTLATKGNFNNHIGVPLTLLSITKKTEISIVEMGANHIGEIAELCEIAQPNFGLITNIGKAHLEGFGSIEGIIETKKALYDYLEHHNGVAFVNDKDEILKELSKNIPQIIYGSAQYSDFKGKLVECNPFLTIEWDRGNAKMPGNRVQTKIIGDYNFDNIMASIAIGSFFNVPVGDIMNALESFESSANRSQFMNTSTNKVILDAYNANPTSMNASIINFSHMDAEEKVAIIGDMFELGKESSVEHQVIIDLLKGQPFKQVILVGSMFSSIENKSSGFLCFKDVEQAYQYLKENPIKNSSVLVKGSRGVRIEKIVELL